jgi:hypothetical protein
MAGVGQVQMAVILPPASDRKRTMKTDPTVGRVRGGDEGDIVPGCLPLEGFAKEGGGPEAVALESLDSGTTLVVSTRNSRYRLVVLDGVDRSVLVEGGSLFPTPTEAHVQGASAGGSLVKTGWIGVGLHLELQVGLRQIITSRVRSVTFEDRPPWGGGSRRPVAFGSCS